MESRRKLDIVGRSTNVSFYPALSKVIYRWTRIYADLIRVDQGKSVAAVLVFGVLLLSTCGVQAQMAPSVDIAQLAQQQRWQEIADRLRTVASRSADLNYYYGLALAQLGNYKEARVALRAGQDQEPKAKRFPTELAGVAFKEKKYREAKSWLQRTLQLDPTDSYANDFLATIYFLEGNLEAALKYWNPIGKPRIGSVSDEPALRINPALLDRAFAFAPANVLRLPDLLTSEARIAGLGIFPVYKFQLNAQPDNTFDLVFRATEDDGCGPNKWAGLLSSFRGVFYQTIYPSYFNLHGSATNFTSLLRWDAQKRRAMGTISGPMWRDPRFRYSLNVDLRNENWTLFTAFKGPASELGAMNLRRQAVAGQVFSFNSGRWGWSTGMELSHRDYRSIFAGTALTPNLVVAGFQLKQLGGIRATVLRVPERRVTITAAGSDQAARVWSTPVESFLKLQGFLESNWLPRAEGNDYEMTEKIRGGKTFGTTPFDELFMLGLERDNDLPLRAHIGTRHGRKGAAPLGRNYFLSNWEINKNVYDNGLFGIKISPFLDTGKITDPIPALGSHKWLFDTGGQLKFRVLTVALTFTYGKDLRTGLNAFYFTAQ